MPEILLLAMSENHRLSLFKPNDKTALSENHRLSLFKPNDKTAPMIKKIPREI